MGYNEMKLDLHNSIKARGFTLIELLVVISIISLLSSIVLASLNSARSKARDAKRISEISELQKALELYYDKYGSYPISGSCNAGTPNSGWCNSIESQSGGRWIRTTASGMAPDLSEFLPKDPVDPQQGSSPNWSPGGGGTYFYYAQSYGGTGQWYMIVYGLENANNAIKSIAGVRACDGTYFDYGASLGIMTVGGSCGR